MFIGYAQLTLVPFLHSICQNGNETSVIARVRVAPFTGQEHQAILSKADPFP